MRCAGLATRIPGLIGTLGEEFPGYFPVGDGEKLRGLLLRAEGDVRVLPVTETTLRPCCKTDPTQTRDRCLAAPAQGTRKLNRLIAAIISDRRACHRLPESTV